MSTHKDKETARTQKAVSHSPSPSEPEKTVISQGIEDRRPEALLQRKLKALANSGASKQTIQKKSRATGLPQNLKSGAEQVSGVNLSDVKVHFNSDQPAQLQAHAFAQGSEIHLAPGQERHLPHEAWHVVQQKKGKVKSTLQMKGVAVNDDRNLEKEADIMGAKALEKGKALQKKEAPFVQGATNSAPFSPVVQRKDDPNITPNITAGQNPMSLEDANALRFAYRELPEAQVRKIHKDLLVSSKAEVVTLTQNDPNFPSNPTDDEVNQVVTAFQNAIDNQPHDNIFQAYITAWNDASINGIAARFTLINHFFSKLKSGFLGKVRSSYGRLDKELKQRNLSLGSKVGEMPDQTTKDSFAKALMGLPGLKELIAQIKSNSGVKPKQEGYTGKTNMLWKDGGKLVDNIVKRPALPDESAVADTPNEFNNIKAHVQKADNFYNQLVEKSVLSKINRPSLVYHLVNAFDRIGNQDQAGNKSLTAHQSGNEVHFGQGVFPWIVIHEVGHYIEDNLPRQSWQDIQLLMRARHTAAGGGTVVNDPSGDRLKGNYPATGPYTSRAYATGTEMTSLTLEELSRSGNLDNLIQRDPQQVAVVIRNLRPEAYASYGPLRKFDQYLP